jgi:hypothetical protein
LVQPEKSAGEKPCSSMFSAKKFPPGLTIQFFCRRIEKIEGVA